MNPEDIAKILLEINAVTLKTDPPFTWVSGIKSPIYCDNRLILSFQEKRKQIVDAYLEVIDSKNLQCDIIAGVATGAIAWGALIAVKLDKPFIYVRSKAKEHGKTNQIEGRLEKGQKVLVIEDLVSTGGSSFSAVESVREAGGIVDDCLAIFTYEFAKAKKKFEEGKCNLYTLSSITPLIKVAKDTQFIDEQDAEVIADFFTNPPGWGKKHGFE